MSARSFFALAALCVASAGSARALQRAPASCEQLETAARANPDNSDLAVALGRCVVRDEQIIVVGGDSSRVAFRSNWTTAIRALRRAVQKDPGFAPAYRPLMRMLFAEMRDGCDYATGICEFVAPIAREGDSINTIPRRVVLNAHPGTYDEIRRESRSWRSANLAEARALATQWASVAPNDYRPHEYLGRALLGLGDARGAADELERAAALGTPDSRRSGFWDRIEALIRSDRGSEARRVIDEALADPGHDTTRSFAYRIAALDALLGRSRPVPVDTTLVRKFRAQMDSALRVAPRPLSGPPRRGVKQLLAAGDTAAARAELARVDSAITPDDDRQFSSNQGEMLLHSAELHLALGDTSIAESQLARIEQPFNDGSFRYSRLLWYNASLWIGRAWLLTADLMAARGHVAEAKQMYSRVVGLWSGGDPTVAPVVDSARARLVALASRNR